MQFTEETNKRCHNLVQEHKEYLDGFDTFESQSMTNSFLLHKIAELELKLEKLQNEKINNSPTIEHPMD